MTELVRGYRGKLGDCLDVSRSFTVKMRTSGSAVYDTCCFGVDAENKLSDDRYMVFYNQTSSPAGEITFGDNGGVSEYTVELEKLPPSIAKLVFTVSIDGDGTMGQIQDHTLSLWQDGEEKMRLTLAGKDFESEKAIIDAELYIKTVWRIAVVAGGFNGGLDALLTSYGGELADQPAQPAAPAPTPAPSTPSFTTSTPSPAPSTPSFTTSTPSPAPSTPSFTTSTPSPAPSTPSFTTSTPSSAPSTPSFTTSTPSPAPSTPSFTTSTPSPAPSTPSFTASAPQYNQPSQPQGFGIPQQSSSAQMSQPQQSFGIPQQTSSAQMSQPQQSFGIPQQTSSAQMSQPQQSYGIPQQTSSAQMSQPQQSFGIPQQTSSAQMSQRSGLPSAEPMQSFGQQQPSAPVKLPSGYDTCPLPEIPPIYHQSEDYRTMTVNEALMNVSFNMKPVSYDTFPLPDMPAYGHAAAYDYGTVPVV